MPIDTSCPGCGKTLRVGDEHTGRQARCPSCNTIYTVAGATKVAAGVSLAKGGEEDRWYMKTPEGRIYGPVVKHEMDRWLSEGRITAECTLRTGDDENWQTADQIYGVLRPVVSQTGHANPFGDLDSSAQRRSGGGHSMPTVNTGGNSFAAPHRGVLILIFGILGWVFSCPIFSVAAWVMGSSDLREMRTGRMDSSGMGLTQAGHILGLIYSLLWIGIITIGMFILILAAFAGGF